MTTFENPLAVLFAQHVSDSIDTPLLRWSVRQKLLADANRLGLPRFEANLIIAIVQRQRESRPQSEARPSALTRLAPWLVFVIVQGAIALALWGTLSM